MRMCICGHPADVHRPSKGQQDCLGSKRNGEPCPCLKFHENFEASQQTMKEAEAEGDLEEAGA